MIYALDDQAPEIDPTAWIAPGAHVIGRVRIAAHASVWFGATLRGDNEWVEVGARTNIQESCVLHTDWGFPLKLGEGCTIGHKAMLHGCWIGSGTLVGMAATVLNGAVIGRDSLVGAGALITEGKTFADRSLLVGAPARLARTLDDAAAERLRESARHYVDNAARFARGLAALD